MYMYLFVYVHEQAHNQRLARTLTHHDSVHDCDGQDVEREVHEVDERDCDESGLGVQHVCRVHQNECREVYQRHLQQ